MDGWDVIMYVNMYGCSRFGYPFNDVPCRNSRAFGWVSAFYFCSLILREKVIPEFVVGAAEDPYKHLTPVSPDPQVFCGGFLSPVSDGARDDSNVDCSTDGPFAFFTSNMEAYPPLTDGAGSPVAPRAETPKPKKKKKPKPSKKGST